MKKLMVLVVSGMLVTSGCATTPGSGGLTERESGGLMGAGLGAGTGAIIGSATGHAAVGVAIGTPIGLLAGALIGEGMRRQKEMLRQEYQQQSTQPGYQPQVTGGATRQEIRLKYNPKTGQTFPSRFQVDPVTGDRLEFVKAV